MEAKPEKMSLQLVRTAAVEANPPWLEVYVDESSKVVSFERTSMGIAYSLNVYFTSGTIGTILEHPAQGKMQLFRTECDVKMLKNIMENPRMHIERGYQRRGPMPVAIAVPLSAVPSDLGTEEQSLDEHLKALDCELEGIAAHRDFLSKRWEILKAERMKEKPKKNEGIPGKELESERIAEKLLSKEEEIELGNQCMERGSMLAWSAALDMDEALRKIPLRHVRCLTLTPNGKGFLYSMHNGQSFWSSLGPVPLPVDVDNALRTRIGEHCRPEAISLGSFDRYFMQFANGKAQWNGDDEFIAAVEERFDVEMVAFGKCVGSFVVVYENGDIAWREIPKQLKKSFAGREKSQSKSDYISLGPGGEFFVRFKDGSIQYGGMSSEIVKALKEIKGSIREVTFGGDNSFLARYNPH